jgi:hypothetical protein
MDWAAGGDGGSIVAQSPYPLYPPPLVLLEFIPHGLRVPPVGGGEGDRASIRGLPVGGPSPGATIYPYNPL